MRKLKSKSLLSSNGKRIHPSGSTSTTSLGSIGVGPVSRSRSRKEIGGYIEHTFQDDLQNTIWTNIHCKHFYLAEEAPLCSGNLPGMFGYNTTSGIARSILAGDYAYPPDFDQATREFFEECARIRLMIPKDSVSSTITTDAWRGHWLKMKEKTSSSVSGQHFGHYIAGMQSDHITYLHALVTMLVARRSIVLDRWSKGLSVMLEKIFGCLLITKLRLI
jgi:hypothetical protein